MDKLQCFNNIFLGGLMVLFGLLMLELPKDGFMIVLCIIIVTLIAKGISQLIYYITMARYMVGGKQVFFRAIISLDLAFLTTSFTTVSPKLIMFYLIAVNFFSGLIDILKALESKRNESPHWKFPVFQGGFNVALSIICMTHFSSMKTLLVVYSIGLFYSAGLKIISAFRKTDMVYIS